MILQKIVRFKMREVASRKKKLPLEALMKDGSVLKKKTPSFFKALLHKKPVAVIAEIKRKSPSKGLLCKNFEPARIAQEYKKGGASALSVLTDENFFGGSDQILRDVKKISSLPILRKDFIIDAYQIYEAKKIGADAILLIAAILTTEQLKRFSSLAVSLGLDVLFEAHTASELKKILKAKPKLLGVNNRNLKTFAVDLKTTQKLAKLAPKSALLVAESGIHSNKDLLYLKACGAKAVLVGESLMTQAQPAQALKKLLGKR